LQWESVLEFLGYLSIWVLSTSQQPAGAQRLVMRIGAACWWILLLALAVNMGGKDAACGKSAGRHGYAMNGDESRRACMVRNFETTRFFHLQNWMAENEDFVSTCECATVLATLQSYPESVLVSCTDVDGKITDGQSLGTACVCQYSRCIYVALKNAEKQLRKSREGRSCAFCGTKDALRYRQVPGDMLQAIRAFMHNKLSDEIVSQQPWAEDAYLCHPHMMHWINEATRHPDNALHFLRQHRIIGREALTAQLSWKSLEDAARYYITKLLLVSVDPISTCITLPHRLWSLPCEAGRRLSR
jgi:hypothetical protein